MLLEEPYIRRLGRRDSSLVRVRARTNDALNQMNVASATRATYVPDVQGSIVASLDAASGALTKAGFLPFGESASTAGTFRYTGARIDAETNGLYNMRARMYSPQLGRFLQADPIGTAGGFNLYAYVNNDPLNVIDPSGLTPDSPVSGNVLAGAGAIGLGVGVNVVGFPEAEAAEGIIGLGLGAAAVMTTGAAVLTQSQQAAVSARESQKPDYTYQTYTRCEYGRRNRATLGTRYPIPRTY